MSLWDVLTLVSGGAALGGGLAAARLHGAGGLELIVAVASGIAVAIACIAAVRTVGVRVLGRGASGLQGPSSTALALVYLAAFVWIVISGAIGMQLVAAILRAI